MKKLDSILFIGPPAGGKGTQCTLLEEHNKLFQHFSTGDMIRSEEAMTPEIKAALGIDGVNAGKFSPDEAIKQYFVDVLCSRIASDKFDYYSQIALVDGIPRNAKQVGMMQEVLNVMGVVFLNPPLEQVFKQWRIRAQEEGRLDDSSEEKYVDRLQTYKAVTKPIVSLYTGQVQVNEIDCIDSIQGIHQLVQSAVKDILVNHHRAD